MVRKLILTLYCASLFCVASAMAAEDDTPTLADQNGCKIYNPNPQENESARWSGACKDGFADGNGVLEWYIGGKLEERYEGSLKRGWAEGTGTYTSRSGMRYKGEWKHSMQDGKGISHNPDGSTYDGEWRAGKPHGWGIYRSPDGEAVEGEWENGELKSGGSNRI